MYKKEVEFPLSNSADRLSKWRFVIPALYMVAVTSMMGVVFNNFMSFFAQSLNAVPYIPVISLVYSVTVTMTAPIGGYLGDAFGRRNMALISILVLSLGVFLAAHADSLPVFLVGLAIWGSANGLDETFYNGMICDFFQFEDRTFFLGVSNSVFAGAVMLGSILAGYLLQGATPNTVLYYAVALLLIGWGILFFACPNIQVSQKRKPFDVSGMILSVILIGTVCSWFGLVGESFDILSITSVVMILSTIILSLLFYRVECNTSSPIIDFKLLRTGCFLPVILLMCLNKLQAPITTYAMAYANLVLKYSTVMIGYTQLLSLISVILSPVIGKWLMKTHKFRTSFFISGCFLTASALLMAFVINESTSFFVFMLLRGIGSLATVFVMGPCVAYISNFVKDNSYGSCLAIYTILTYMANSLANAFGGMIFNLCNADVSIAFPRITFICGILASVSMIIAIMCIRNPE